MMLALASILDATSMSPSRKMLADLADHGVF
jgi:hypothetical protein